MSKSLKISHYNHLINQSEMVTIISQDLCVSEQTVNAVLDSLSTHTSDELIKGNAVRLNGLCTFYLRRRDYDATRRANFRIGGGSGTLPEYCYYVYAQISTVINKLIKSHRTQIAHTLQE